MSKQFIHIGLPRTGSTFLQRKIFKHLKGIDYFGPEVTQYHPLFNKLLYADDTLYSKGEKEKISSTFGSENLLLSNELFCGQSLYFNYSNRSRTAHRLSEIFPEATVLIFLRNQPELLRSLYHISLQHKEVKTFEQFINNHQSSDQIPDATGPLKSYYNTFGAQEPLDGYLFTPLTDLYQSLFPKVEIFLFEDLKNRPEKIAEQFGDLFEESFSENLAGKIRHHPPLNSGVNDISVNKLRKINRYYDIASSSPFLMKLFLKRKRKILQKGKSKSGTYNPISRALLNQLKDFYAKDNRLFHQKYPGTGMNNYGEKYFL